MMHGKAYFVKPIHLSIDFYVCSKSLNNTGDSMHGSRQNDSAVKEGKLHLHASSLSLDCWRLANGGVQRCRADVSSTAWF
jgi:hypothetical protein